MKATIRQLATYIERDGFKIKYEGGDAIVYGYVMGDRVGWRVPEELTDTLRDERSKVRRRKLGLT